MSKPPIPDLDTMVNKFKEYVKGNNSYDELDFKEEIINATYAAIAKELVNFHNVIPHLTTEMLTTKVVKRIKSLERELDETKTK